MALMTDKRIVFTTTGSREEADKIASDLVQRSLAACVNVLGPVASTYRWQGKVECAEEFLLLIKTTAAAVERVRGAIRELHSYELPEFVVLPIEAGSEAYLEWIAKCVS
jgi:periplasmic divalent cation tolerance protein